MESPRIGIGTGNVVLEPTHHRQATSPRSFEEAMKGGVQTLLRGAEIATSAMGAPALSAAVRGMRQSAALALPQPGGPVAYPPVLPGMSPGGAGGAGGLALPGGVVPGSDPATAVSGAGADPNLDAVRNLQREAHDYNLELLVLQESTQRENQRFSLVSNTLKAMHDTAKAAIQNLHA